MKSLLVGFALCILVLSSIAQAQSGSSTRRGLVTSGPCPLRCEDLGVPREHCRESQSGAQCRVEDLRQVPGHRSVALVRTGAYKPWSKATSSKMKMERRGLITTAPCPYTCKDAGVPEHLCRESRDGDKCQVEDFTQAPGHRSMMRVPTASYKRKWSKEDSAKLKMERRGLVTSSPCPYNCRIAGVPAELCRERREGDTCYVEDFTQPPGHRSRVTIP